jgi:hypothetical protein
VAVVAWGFLEVRLAVHSNSPHGHGFLVRVYITFTLSQLIRLCSSPSKTIVTIENYRLCSSPLKTIVTIHLVVLIQIACTLTVQIHCHILQSCFNLFV